MTAGGRSWAYRRGDWLGVFDAGLGVVLPPEQRALAARLWELVDAGSDLGDLVDLLAAGGLSDLAALAVVAEHDGGATVLARGAVRIRLEVADGVETVAGDGAATWVERRLSDVARVRVDVGIDRDVADADADGPAEPTAVGVVHAGLVRVSSAELTIDRDALAVPDPEPVVPEPVAPELAARPAVASRDHDGLTRGPDEPTGPLRELPGLPGQEPVPPITARAVAALMVSNGDRVAVDRPVLIGRAPVPERSSGGADPLLLAVPSPHQEISSTHLEVRPGSGVDHGAAVVTDLGSTNGTELRQPGLPPEPLRPGVGVQLIPGAVLDLGDGVTIQAVDA